MMILGKPLARNIGIVAVLVLTISAIATKRDGLSDGLPARNPFTPFAGTLVTGNPASAEYGTGRIYDVGYAFDFTSDQPLRFRPATWPDGLPQNVRIVHEVLMLSWDQPVQRNGAYIDSMQAGYDWPPQDQNPSGRLHFTFHDINGYVFRPPVRINPNANPHHLRVTIMVAFQPNAPGIYTLGPIIVHAKMFGSSGSSSGSSGAEYSRTSNQYSVLCIGQRTDAPCASARNRAAHRQ